MTQSLRDALDELRGELRDMIDGGEECAGRDTQITGLIGLVDKAKTALASQEATQEGWKLVPVEPTEEMLRDGWNAYLGEMKGGFDRFAIVYRAMLSAAPTPPAQAQAEGVTPVYRICVAYDQGFTRGARYDDMRQPYAEGTPEAEAYERGFKRAKETAAVAEPAQAGETPRTLIRPIIGIENRTAQEVFIIMVDRITRAQLAAQQADAERWRKARDILAVEDIERAAAEMVGRIPDEDESRKADVAIDAALQAGGEGQEAQHDD